MGIPKDSLILQLLQIIDDCRDPYKMVVYEHSATESATEFFDTYM